MLAEEPLIVGAMTVGGSLGNANLVDERVARSWEHRS